MNRRARLCAIVSACLIVVLIAASCAHAQKTYQFAPAAPRQPTGDLVDSRFAATATVLPNGQVLIAGGVASENSYTASAELYDPNTGAFTRTGSLASGRAYHTATLLKDGRVLIAGGIGVDGQPVGSAEIDHPSNGKFSTTGTMLQARYNLAATLLPNGKVLMTGGDTTALTTTNTATAEAVRFRDRELHRRRQCAPVSMIPIPQILSQRQNAGGPWQAHGDAAAGRELLIAGGGDASGTAQAKAEVYDSARGKFVPAAPMNFARQEHRATLLPNGTVLITGGVDHHGSACDCRIIKPGFAQIYPDHGGISGSAEPTSARVAMSMRRRSSPTDRS